MVEPVKTAEETKPIEKICFVISPIGKEGSPTRQRADDVRDYVINKVVNTLGYKTVRADDINKTGLISPDIIKHIMNDALAVAYLAEDNPNVFFELAIRFVTKKSTIILREPSQELPFDIKDVRAIDLDTTILRSVDEAKEKLKEQIESISEVSLTLLHKRWIP